MTPSVAHRDVSCRVRYRRAMPTTAKAPPEMTITWAQVAALRLARQHLADRLPADRLLDVVREHVGIQAQVMGLAELQLNARIPADAARSRRRSRTWRQIPPGVVTAHLATDC